MSEENKYNFSKKFKVCTIINILLSLILLTIVGFITFKASVFFV